jgi:hypothetical protein
MPTTTPITKASSGPSISEWKNLLSQARKIRGRSRMAAYHRAKLLVAVFDDRGFRATHGNIDDFRAADMLDAEIDDLCLTFLDLRRVLLKFPGPAAWKKSPLRSLLVEATKTATEPHPLVGRPIPVNGETRKQYEAQLQTARQDWGRDRAAMTSRIDQMQARIAELEAENRALREENRVLREQVAGAIRA